MGDISVSETSYGYRVEISPPSGTARAMADQLPGISGEYAVKMALSSTTAADMTVTKVTMCVEAPGAGCGVAADGSGDDVVNVDITSAKSTKGKGGIPTTVAAMCTFATSGSAQVFCH